MNPINPLIFSASWEKEMEIRREAALYAERRAAKMIEKPLGRGPVRKELRPILSWLQMILR